MTWVEPALQIEFSGERGATVVAGKYDTLVPPKEPARYSGAMGHQAVAPGQGFLCTVRELPGLHIVLVESGCN